MLFWHSVIFIARQLNDRKDDIKKLREELYNDSESNKKTLCGNSCQEALLKKQIKDSETYISSLHSEIDMLHKKQDLLQQRVSSWNIELTFPRNSVGEGPLC
jgi:septal ring factor EnvC (AmiA/AmiB activator)